MPFRVKVWHLPEEFLCANVGANNIASILVTTPQGHILIDTGTEKMAAVIFPNMEDGKPYQILFGGPPTPITGDPKYDTRPQDAFDSY